MGWDTLCFSIRFHNREELNLFLLYPQLEVDAYFQRGKKKNANLISTMRIGFQYER